MKTSLLSLLLASASVALAAYGPNNRGSNANGGACFRNANPNCPAGECPAATATAAISLSAGAQAALIFQIEEERMARDLYAEFGRKHGLTVFQNIAKSEERHESMFSRIAARAGVAVPAATAGRFASADVQSLYDRLLALGLASPEAALRAGALVEEKDIADLRDLAAATENADLKLAAGSQEKASANHLAAFARNLSARGITYEAQVLPAGDVADLVKNAAGGGMGGRGMRGGSGMGYRGGRGA